MLTLNRLLNKSWKINCLLFLCSFLYYYIYLQHIFLNANSVLSITTGDSIKNYFVFVTHIINDKELINFPNFNYPFGEHVLYTDSMPLLTYVFKALPFTHNYLIGCLHLLILFSYIVTPCIYFKLFNLFNINWVTAFLCSLAIVVLSPQFSRIGGHFGLSFACFIPYLIYLLLKYSMHSSNVIVVKTFALNLLLFFIHPYMGIGLSFFTILYLTLFKIVNKTNWANYGISVFIMGMLPIIIFKIFMNLTDTHTGRSDFPYGMDVYISNIESVFVSCFNGPFEHFMGLLIKIKRREWEGLSYVGFFTFILLVVLIIMTLIYIKRFRYNKTIIALFFSGLILVLVSFGWHNVVLKLLNINIVALNQFRALGRFSWFFYYSLPVVLIVSLNKLSYEVFKRWHLKIMIAVAVLFLFFNLIEGHYYIKASLGNMYKDKNIFRYNLLSKDEKKLIADVKKLNTQAILPIPFYQYGSEVIDRMGMESLYISMLVSFHCNLPIISSLISRTSVNESVEQMSLLNPYINHDYIFSKLSNKSIAVIQTPNSEHFPDEARLISKANFKGQYDLFKMYTINKSEFDFNMSEIKNNCITLNKDYTKIDSLGIIYIKTDTVKPYILTNQSDFGILYKLSKAKLPMGKYIVSFKYNFNKLNFKSIDCNFVVERKKSNEQVWEVFEGVRRGHLYKKYNYILFEYFVNIDSLSNYTFFLNSQSKENYSVSDFLLRPETTNVIIKADSNLTKINNHNY
jgi:hypothetical protein